MDAGAERQRAQAAPVGGDVELVDSDPVAIGVPGGHEHDRSSREGDPAVFDFGDRDPGGERRDRLVAKRFVDGRECQTGRVSAQDRPLIGASGEQPQRVGELALARVDAADEDVEDQVAQLVVVEALALGLRGYQIVDQIFLIGRGAALGDQRVGPRVKLRYRLLDLLALGDQAVGVELPLDPVRPFVQPRRVTQRRAHHRGDHQRRIRLGERRDELAAPVRSNRAQQLLEERTHRRAVAIDRARRERRVDEVAQPAMVGPVDVDDVADDLLVQRPVRDLE